MSNKRVVITGLGVITPLGIKLQDFWSNLISGKSGIRSITQYDTTRSTVRVCAPVMDFSPALYMDEKLVDRTVRLVQLAIVAAKNSVESARLNFGEEDATRIGVCVGTSLSVADITAEYDVLKAKGPKRVSPLFIPKPGPHMASAQIGLVLGAKGPNFIVNTACASGAEAISHAYDDIVLGYADVMIAGGTDSNINELVIAGMGNTGALSREVDPAKACRPFDLNRSGFVFGEGSGIVVLETLDHAKTRGAEILAELAGTGRSFDAFNEAAPSPEMEAMAMEQAIANSGLSINDIDYINAHGTGTKLNDSTETLVIKQVFGERAYNIPVSSNKSMLGHIISAAGAIEAVASVLTIQNSIIPPTINDQTPNPECDLDYVPNKARNGNVDACLSNSFGMGGQNCCLVLKKYQG